MTFLLSVGEPHEAVLFERCLNRLKQYRPIATRYEKMDENKYDLNLM